MTHRQAVLESHTRRPEGAKVHDAFPSFPPTQKKIKKIFFWWLIQIIAPITHLPPELLQRILIIIIDKTNDPPLVLM
jgi:hypothetical protein